MAALRVVTEMVVVAAATTVVVTKGVCMVALFWNVVIRFSTG
jgi:hypothetical protein